MSFFYTQIPFLRHFNTGVVFPAFFLFALPLIMQQKGCGDSNPPVKVGCTSLITPAMDAVDVATNTTLTWNAVPGDGITYDIMVGSQANAADLGKKENHKETSIKFSEDFPAGATIFVRIIAKNKDDVKAEGCVEMEFTTQAAVDELSCTQLKQPASDATGLAKNVTLEWEAAAGATAYILQVGEQSDVYGILNENIGNKTSFSLDFSFGQKVFAKVIPVNGVKQAENCAESTFTIKDAPAPPPAPSCSVLKLTSPSASANVPLNTGISWEGASGLIHGYSLKIGTTSGGQDIMSTEIVTDKMGASISLTDPLPDDKDIFVSITPFNEANGRQDAASCQVFTFKTKPLPPQLPEGCATVTFPKDNATGVSLSDNITWEAVPGASNYKLQAGLEDGTFNLLDKEVGNSLSHPAYFLFYNKKTFLRVLALDERGNPMDPACKTISFTVGARPDGAPKYIRRSIAEMPPGHPDLETYKEGIRLMKALDSSDPFHWDNQAQVHGKSGQCQHRNWHFLPWHRAYLFYLEEAVRVVTGNNDFALPYWDWTKHPTIPGVFWGGASNPLWHENRRANENSTSWTHATNEDAVQGILDNETFSAFGSGGFGSGELEATPHNIVHGNIGGSMGRTTTAGLDPIFYCHHANVDRLWAIWDEKTTGGKSPTDSNWLENKDVTYDGHFTNRQRQPAKVLNQDMVSSRNDQMDYRYDDQKEVLTASDINAFEGKKYYVDNLIENLAFETALPPMMDAGVIVERSFTITDNEFYTRAEQVSRSRPDQRQLRFIKLYIDDIEPPRNANISVRIFINCDYLEVDTPDSDPHYVTTFSFFESAEEHEHEEAGFVFDLTETLRALKANEALLNSFPNQENGLRIQLVARALFDDGSTISFKPGKAKVGFVVKREFLE